MSYASYGLAYDIPNHARKALDLLESAGFEGWVVGGWVRDALMGAPSHDVDITSSAPWEEAERLFVDAGYAVHETGAAHGTVTIVVDGEPIELTTYRVETGYTDHRHPDQVRFVREVRDDLARRDFTINAMAYHPQRGLLDLFGGREDLSSGMIRAVGDPAQRFAEDALRVLRAVRFACRMGFAIESATHEALAQAAPGLSDIASERIGQELCGILESGRVGWALLHEPEVLFAAVPELAAMQGFDQHSPWHAYDVLVHTIHVCNAVEAFTAGVPSLGLRWAALLHDVGKPATFTMDETGRGHFYRHPHEGARMAEEIMRRLGLPGDLMRETCALVRYHDHMVRPTARSIRRMMARLETTCPGRAFALSHELMDIKRADAVSKMPKCAWFAVELDEMDRLIRELECSGVALKASDLAIGGREVMETTGVAPGPIVGEVLEVLLAAVIDGEVANTYKDLMIELMRLVQEQE